MAVQHWKTADFDAAVAEAPLAMVDFWASWCGPCKMIAPVVEELAERYGDKVLMGKVNVDEEPELARRVGAGGGRAVGVVSFTPVVFLKKRPGV